MSPLLVWALRTVTDFAPDILAWREARRLLARISPAPKPGERADIRAYLQRLRDSQPLPVFTGHQASALAHARQAAQPGKTTRARPLVHSRLIAGTLGVTATQVTALLTREPHLLEGLRSGTGVPLPTPITARLSGRPWRNAIDLEDVIDLALQLATAALLTVAYLSGMRPQEKRAELQQMQHSVHSITGVSAGRMGVRRGCRNLIGGSTSTACARLAPPQQCCI